MSEIKLHWRRSPAANDAHEQNYIPAASAPSLAAPPHSGELDVKEEEIRGKRCRKRTERAVGMEQWRWK